MASRPEPHASPNRGMVPPGKQCVLFPPKYSNNAKADASFITADMLPIGTAMAAVDMRSV
jgi:hypothetical protein